VEKKGWDGGRAPAGSGEAVAITHQEESLAAAEAHHDSSIVGSLWGALSPSRVGHSPSLRRAAAFPVGTFEVVTPMTSRREAGAAHPR